MKNIFHNNLDLSYMIYVMDIIYNNGKIEKKLPLI